jgi:hypothetical protein
MRTPKQPAKIRFAIIRALGEGKITYYEAMRLQQIPSNTERAMEAGKHGIGDD